MKQKLIDLINQSKFQNLFGSFNIEDYRFLEVGLMPKDSVYRTFERRSKLNENITEELLEAMRSFTEDKIQITDITYQGRSFVVFTDSKFLNLIGIICFE